MAFLTRAHGSACGRKTNLRVYEELWNFVCQSIVSRASIRCAKAELNFCKPIIHFSRYVVAFSRFLKEGMVLRVRVRMRVFVRVVGCLAIVSQAYMLCATARRILHPHHLSG